MTVSAIIPCYNAAVTIERAVQSLLQQSVPIDEIIVVNDGSTDGSLAVLRTLEKSHTQLFIIEQKNRGVSGARNRAIAVAQGEFLLTLDADDYFENTFVEKALNKFIESANYGAVMCGYVRVVDNKKVLPYIPAEISLKSCLLNNGALSCLLFKKKVIIEAGGYDEAMVNGYEDWDLNIRILKLGYTYGIVNEVLFNYTDTEGSRTYTATENDVQLRLQMYEKYRPDYEEHGAYIYEELITDINKLDKVAQSIKQSKSFKLGHKIVLFLNKIVGYFKIKEQ